MPKSRKPRVSEFNNEAEAEEHDRWVRERVCRSLAETNAPVPQDDVMAEMEAIIERAEQRRTRNG